MATYTYAPSLITSNGKDAMRFQLGDTVVDGGSGTAFLSDEEINAMIEAYPNRWQRAKLALIEAVCKRLSFEVDFKDDGTSFALSQRAERWNRMYEEAKKELSACTPSSGAVNDAKKSDDGGHYFYAGMLDSPYVDGGERR